MYDSVTESLSLLTTSPATKGGARKGTPKGRGSKASLEQGELTSSHASSTASNAVTTIDSVKSIRKYICPLVSGLSPYTLNEVDEALSAANVEGELEPKQILTMLLAEFISSSKVLDSMHITVYVQQFILLESSQYTHFCVILLQMVHSFTQVLC